VACTVHDVVDLSGKLGLVAVAVLALIGAACGDNAESTTTAAATTAPDTTEVKAGATTTSLPGALEVAIDIVGAPGQDGIKLGVTVANQTGAATIVAKPEISPTLVYFEVRDATGAVVPFDGPWLTLRSREPEDFVELAPGDETRQEFDLRDWYPLPAGNYTVVVEYRNTQGDRGTGLTVPIVAGVVSLPIEFEVAG
jgi:hypothetical protein